MRIVEPSFELVQWPAEDECMDLLELCARTCYKSEGKIKPGSAEKLIRVALATKARGK